MTLRLIFLSFFLLILGLSPAVFSAEHQRIDTLGVSKKGQFVAVEEYSYAPSRQMFIVSIRILNVWTKKFVGESVNLEVPARRPHTLHSVRMKAKLMAQEELLKFNIVSG
jgi:hypothetical protein